MASLQSNWELRAEASKQRQKADGHKNSNGHGSEENPGTTRHYFERVN